MVTPLRTPALILGKTIPFAILGYLEMSIALAIGILWFRIPFVGSWPLLYALAFVYLLMVAILVWRNLRLRRQRRYLA